MKLRIAFILFIIILSVSYIFSEDVTEDISEKSNKVFVFNFGGGVNQFGFITLLNIEDKVYYRVDYDDFAKEDEEHKKTIKSTMIDYDFTGHGINYFLTTSFVYYTNNYFGLGISSSLGFGILFSRGLTPFNIFDVFANMRFVNKIGNYNKKSFFI